MIGARGPLVLGLLALAGLMAPYSAAAEARRPPNQRLIGAPAALRPVGFIRHGLTPCLATPQARPQTGGFPLAGGRGVT